ncbi:MAG: hypothetical protein QOD51_921 [Candidatus Eremiobacteraeota bacterium]|jgi:hypothetical protein|nr:hypothetical protein [Candidatus Eremiobacteraeota bacterium]
MVAVDKAQLLAMTGEQLDKLFADSPPGPIPDGDAEGTAIIGAGTPFSSEIAEFINIFAWKGKTFDGKRGVLTNRITLIGLNAIVAEVYVDKSWFDGKDCITLDYSKTSMVAHWIRDEIREVSPGFYLGLVYWNKKRLCHFALKFPTGAAAATA